MVFQKKKNLMTRTGNKATSSLQIIDVISNLLVQDFFLIQTAPQIERSRVKDQLYILQIPIHKFSRQAQ